jgi:hypothetical protein
MVGEETYMKCAHLMEYGEEKEVYKISLTSNRIDLVRGMLPFDWTSEFDHSVMLMVDITGEIEGYHCTYHWGSIILDFCK